MQNRTVKIEPESHASKIMKSIIGKIKIQLASALKQLEELEEDYIEWLNTNFIREEMNITKYKEEPTAEYYAIRSEVLDHINQEINKIPKKDSRKKRSTFEVTDAISNIGKIYRQFRLENSDEGYNIDASNMENLFKFTSMIANRLNGTLRYLRKNSALKFRNDNKRR